MIMIQLLKNLWNNIKIKYYLNIIYNEKFTFKFSFNN